MTVTVDLREASASLDTSLVTETTITRECMYHFNVLSDGTIVMLTQLHGDFDQARALLDASSNVLQHDVPEQGDGLAYIHCTMKEPLKSFLPILQEAEIIIDMPIDFLSDDRIRVTIVGDHETLRQVHSATAEVVDIEIERTGDYRSESRRLSSLLTERQREILTTAVEQGYYEVPRRATITDIADEMDRSVATVGEHLQKIEATVLSRLAF